MAYQLIGRNTLIPRKTFTGRHRRYVKNDPNNPFENADIDIQHEEFDVLECVIQPVSGRAVRDYNLQSLPEGYRDYDSFYVYSSTILYAGKEGTNELPDQILIPNQRGVQKWYTVIKSDDHKTTDVNRYKAFVVLLPEAKAEQIKNVII